MSFTPAKNDLSNVPPEHLPSVTNANVTAAIADDPAASREALELDYIAASPATGLASTDLAALVAAVTAAAAAGKSVFLPPGNSYVISDEWLIGKQKLTIRFGIGTSITQQNAGKHAIVLDPASPPNYLTIVNPTIVGTGHATSTKAGIYGRRGDGGYLCGDLTIIGGSISGFASGVHLRNVVKFRADKLDLLNNVTGYYLDKVDTYWISNTRVTAATAGGAIPASRCFFFGDQTFGGLVTMGEFGGANIARFCEISGSGVEAVFEGCNLEAFTSAQVSTISAAGPSAFIFRNGRCAPKIGAQATDSFLSCDATGTQHTIEISGLSDWLPTSYRIVEYLGSAAGPAILGTMIRVDYAPTAGGAATLSHYAEPQQRDYTGALATLPVSSWFQGQTIRWANTSTLTDTWVQQPLVKLFNNRAGTSQRFTVVNEFHHQIIAAKGATSSLVGSENALLAVLPKTMLVDTGESFHLRVAGKTAANANSKKITIELNSSVLFDTGFFTSSNAEWRLDFTVMANAGAETWDAQFLIADQTVGVGGVLLASGDTSGPGWYGNGGTPGTFIVKMTTPTAAGDLISRNAKAWWSRGVPLLNT